MCSCYTCYTSLTRSSFHKPHTQVDLGSVTLALVTLALVTRVTKHLYFGLQNFNKDFLKIEKDFYFTNSILAI